MMMTFETLNYQVTDRVATITLNRPERLNAISRGMPSEIRNAVELANNDDLVHVILLQGAGKAFCAGYDLKNHAEAPRGQTGTQEMPWDPFIDFQLMDRNTQNFQSLWRSYKPTICKIHGYAVAGGSDIALSCDLIVMAEDAKIGYPPARVWGCPTTMMWVFRIGAERAKRMLFTGDLIDGIEAERIGLVTKAVPADELDAETAKLCDRIKGVPKNQLWMQKTAINSAFENMGMRTTQTLATVFDGITRHSPEGLWFKDRAEEVGFHEAVKERDSGAPIKGSKPPRNN
ncbi:crotonase/enoyl-CoA hydratase family protein [Afipia massiliensis]|uniref:Crotonase/enoyl-CoA hydratase family protein n=2 Tax=Afipia massiliensis TaxID=211460 RepID=A0A4U6BT92_9BRAD|nr:crotonase/enoyl-CoA hydratase family protein [Afipia massiliensis]